MIELAARTPLAIAIGLLFVACGAPPPDAADGGFDATVIGRGFGESCTSTEECTSGLCLTVAPGRNVCTSVCDAEVDCPAGDSWGCIAPEGFGARVCGCAATTDEEVCGDGLDNECNGRVDDCRICFGRPVPEDDPDNCGACGVQCDFDQECSGGACRCPAGRTECGGACVDVRTNTEHCGACGEACPAGARCLAGVCDCLDPTPDRCGDVCTDVQRSRADCGRCGNACPTGQACVGGTCSCDDPAFPTYCEGTGCVDTTIDERHCGTCDNACAAAQSCVAGVCRCPIAGQQVCGDVCISVSNDPLNCGACGRACAPGERCAGTTCACDSGVRCGTTCMPVDDRLNCGACGVSCRTDQLCMGGACACPWPTVECGGTCIDVRSDPTNCGACGVTCGGGQICAGSCRCAISGETYCPALDDCVDLRTDATSCGSCGNACPAAQTCSASVCRCPTSTPTFCGATETCVDLQNDAANCGSCGNACPAATICRFGSCRCASSSETYCASVDACVPLASDDAHCGACDRVCPAETSCRFSNCACDAAGLSLCGTSCVDRQTDEANCGICGRVCTGGRECTAGTCQCPAPAPGGLVRVTTNPTRSHRVRIASDGTRVAMVWSEEPASGTTGYTMQLALRESDGAPVAGTERTLEADAGTGSPDVVWSGAEYGAVWTRAVLGRARAMFQRFSAAGAPIGAPIDITAGWSGTVDVDNLRIAWSSVAGYAVLIRSRSTSALYFQLLGTDASALPLPVVLTGSAGVRTPLSMTAASDGRFGALYGSTFQIVNADGSVTAPTVTLATSVTSGVIGHDGTSWVVAGSRSLYVSGSSRMQIVLLRGATFSTVHLVHDVPTSTATLDDVAMVIDSGVATLVWTDDTDGSGSRRLGTARARLPTGGASYQVISPPTILMSDYTVAADTSANDNPPVLTHVGTSAIATAWPDTRWGQLEIYVQPATIGTCM